MKSIVIAFHLCTFERAFYFYSEIFCYIKLSTELVRNSVRYNKN